MARNGLDPSTATPFRFLEGGTSLSVANPLGELQRAAHATNHSGNAVDHAVAAAAADASRLAFNFDKVLSPSCSQAEVFDEVRDLVTSALDGYQVGS